MISPGEIGDDTEGEEEEDIFYKLLIKYFHVFNNRTKSQITFKIIERLFEDLWKNLANLKEFFFWKKIVLLYLKCEENSLQFVKNSEINSHLHLILLVKSTFYLRNFLFSFK